MMKALSIKNANVVEIDEVAIPQLKKDEILCRVVYTGVCGTDLAIYTGETDFVKSGQIKYPCRIGHEWSGYVVKTGEAVTKFKEGDRVVSDNGFCCRECEMCLSGQPQKCLNNKSLGTINCWDGSYAEYLVIPECHLYHLPDQISYLNAATIEPLTIAYAGMTKFPVEGRTVAVIGTGAIGLAAMALASKMGASKVIALGRTDGKLELTKTLGATDTINIRNVDAEEEILRITDGKGADFVVETSGAPSASIQALKIAANMGDLALIGFYEVNPQDFPLNLIVSKSLTVKGIMGEWGLVPKIIEYMTKSGLSLESMVTRIISLENTPEYFINHKEYHSQDIKVMVKITDAE